MEEEGERGRGRKRVGGREGEGRREEREVGVRG